MDTNQQVSDQSNQASGEVVDNVENPSKDSVAYDTYRKVLSEKKKVQEQLAELAKERDAANQNKLQAEGKKDEVIEALRKQMAEKDKTLETKTNAYAWNVVSAQIKSELAREGCVNPDKALRLIDKEELAGIEVSDDYLVNIEDLKRVVDKVRTENADIRLFNKSASVKDLNPKAGVNPVGNEPANKTEKMSAAELREYTIKNFG